MAWTLFWFLLSCNFLLILWTIFFFDDLGDHLHWWEKRSLVRRYVLLDRFISNEKDKDDFDEYIADSHLSIFSFFVNVVVNFWSFVNMLLEFFGKGHLNDGLIILGIQLAFNLFTSFVFLILTLRYIKQHNLRDLKLFLNFFVPGRKVIYQILPIYDRRYSLAIIGKMFNLSNTQIAFFLSVFADQGELLDRISVANKMLKEKDVKSMVDSNRKLREEINELYSETLDKIKQGLAIVKNLERKQNVADKQVKVLSFHNKGENYVKQFEVVKELHRKD